MPDAATAEATLADELAQAAEAATPEPEPTPEPAPAPESEATPEADETIQPEALAPEASEVGAELATLDAPPPALLPPPSRWEQIRSMAAVIAHSNLVVPALRGKPDDVTLILLTANDLGISATQALSKVHIIEGRPTMAAELMKALVVRAGHRMWKVEKTNERATVGYQRMLDGQPAGPEQTVTWTIDDARQAKLDGKDVWKKYPRRMLWARAISEACNEEFSDVLAGITYDPEELGYIDTMGDEAAGVAAETRTPEEIADAQDFAAGEAGRKQIIAEVAALPDDRRLALREEWTRLAQDRVLHSPTNLRRSELEQAAQLVARFRDAATLSDAEGIADAEIVGAEAPAAPPAEPEAPPGAAEPAEPPEPAEPSFMCSSCGALVVGENTEAKHAAKCPEAPF